MSSKVIITFSLLSLLLVLSLYFIYGTGKNKQALNTIVETNMSDVNNLPNKTKPILNVGSGHIESVQQSKLLSKNENNKNRKPTSTETPKLIKKAINKDIFKNEKGKQICSQILANVNDTLAECMEILETEEMEIENFNGRLFSKWTSVDGKTKMSFGYWSDSQQLKSYSKVVSDYSEHGNKEPTWFQLKFDNDLLLWYYAGSKYGQKVKYNEFGDFESIYFETDNKVHTITFGHEGGMPRHHVLDINESVRNSLREAKGPGN